MTAPIAYGSEIDSIKPLVLGGDTGIFFPDTDWEKQQLKREIHIYNLATSKRFSGEVKLKEAEVQRLRLTISEDKKTIETTEKLLKAETTRADSNESEMKYYKDLSEKSKKHTRFWRAATIVVAAIGGTYVGVDQLVK